MFTASGSTRSCNAQSSDLRAAREKHEGIYSDCLTLNANDVPSRIKVEQDDNHVIEAKEISVMNGFEYQNCRNPPAGPRYRDHVTTAIMSLQSRKR